MNDNASTPPAETSKDGLPASIPEELKPEVNRIVQERLDRDRKSRGTELQETKTALSTATEALAKADEKLRKLEGVEATAAETKKTLEETEAGLLAQIPEARRSLVPTTLPLGDRVKYIRDNLKLLIGADTAEPPVTPPSTPPAEEKKSGDRPELPHGFTNLEEFARNKPREYLQWRAEHP